MKLGFTASALSLLVAVRLEGTVAYPPKPIEPEFQRASLVVVARLTAIDLSLEPEGWALARLERTIKGVVRSRDLLFSPGYTLTAGYSYLLFLQPAKPRFAFPAKDRLFNAHLPFFSLLNSYRRAFAIIPRFGGLKRPYSSDPISPAFQVDTEFWVVPESLRHESVATQNAGGWPVTLVSQEPMIAYLQSLLAPGTK